MEYEDYDGNPEKSRMKILCYTGIGSRETPPEILAKMTQIATYLASRDYYLRSGGAPGADSAFEDGAGDKKQIFLPWRGFNGNKSNLFEIHPDAFETASRIHPAWDRCSQAAKKLHARNVHQVLGCNLNDPSEFVVCWTKDGEAVGGTATAIKLALHIGISVFNLGSPDGLQLLRKRMKQP